ncbi:unnamed protein product, partial [Porites evermanni]
KVKVDNVDDGDDNDRDQTLKMIVVMVVVLMMMTTRSTVELKGGAQYSPTTTEQASYQGAEFPAKREPFGQQTRCEERPISNGVCFNERAVSENYHLLKAEYGQVLFERDQAHRTLQIANLQRRSVLKQRRKNGAY